MGGAYAVCSKLMHKWKNSGYLKYPQLFERSYLGEDSVVTIMAFAAGYKLGCFNSDGNVFGVWYQQPEMSAQELYDHGYSLIHSIKCVEQQHEDKLRREYFQILKRTQNSQHSHCA